MDRDEALRLSTAKKSQKLSVTFESPATDVRRMCAGITTRFRSKPVNPTLMASATAIRKLIDL